VWRDSGGTTIIAGPFPDAPVVPEPTCLIAETLASGPHSAWGSLVGASASLAFAELAAQTDAPLLVIADDPRHADQLEAELRFFSGGSFPVLHFVEWETLPWDSFSPHQDIISQRLLVLSKLPSMRRGVIVASTPALLQRLPPLDYVAARSLSLRTGQQLSHDEFTESLASAGYLRVPQVSEHGEFAVRGSLIDVFPMGSDKPVRIDFFDDEMATRWSRSTCCRPARCRWTTMRSGSFARAIASASRGSRAVPAFIVTSPTALPTAVSSITCRCSSNIPPGWPIT
jgi:hypothetical protein